MGFTSRFVPISGTRYDKLNPFGSRQECPAVTKLTQRKASRSLSTAGRGSPLLRNMLRRSIPDESAAAHFLRADTRSLRSFRVRPAGIEPATVCLKGNCSTD